MQITIEILPADFELKVKELLENTGNHLSEFRVQRLEKLSVPDGSYEIDITVRFQAIGANFLILVECKHHKNPIKRDVVQILHDKLRAIGAQKGMIFATSNFQRGALEFAKAHNIALVQITDGRIRYQTRSFDGPVNLPAWVPQYAGMLVKLDDEGKETYTFLDEQPNKLITEIHGSR